MALSYKTVCNIRDPQTGNVCGRSFFYEGIDVPHIGEIATMHTQLFIKKLMDHLGKYHPHHAMLANNIGSQLFSYLVMTSFITDDPGALTIAERLRAHFFAQVRRQMFSDEDLTAICDALGFQDKEEDPLRDAVLDAFKDFRDCLTETGKYLPEHLKPPPPPAEGANSV